jgi:osmotically-inducible protein OsmY
MRRILSLAVFSGCLLMGSFVRCASAQVQQASQKSSEDDQIDYKVRNRLVGDADVKGGALEVSVKDGVVTIKGRVDTEKGKSKATKLAKKVKGVKEVQNLLEVGPPK